ncbi:hypothetical protein E2C01_017460 [Portunus trituberculatus]|uniref:Uncharacterized protein n=1 Tax=Portunus trituberculatus TaxID=210409 RepID=A0A5B7DTI4_PORTR|nr:hypothetical protein [Portunus trituberculatus]
MSGGRCRARRSFLPSPSPAPTRHSRSRSCVVPEWRSGEEEGAQCQSPVGRRASLVPYSSARSQVRSGQPVVSVMSEKRARGEAE